MTIDLRRFPNLLKSGFIPTSLPTTKYNCIAWAAGDDSQWWEPDPYNDFYWPPAVPRQYTMHAYIAAFASLGYQRCKDGSPEEGFEKIVIYSIHGRPTHAARRINDTMWTSKLGPQDDISHAEDGVDGPDYGQRSVYMRRAI